MDIKICCIRSAAEAHPRAVGDPLFDEEVDPVGDVIEFGAGGTQEIYFAGGTVTRDISSDDEPMVTRYAGAVAHFLGRKQPLFFDDNLLAGTTCGPEADQLLGYYRELKHYVDRYGTDGIGSLIVSMTRSLSDLLVVYLFLREVGLLDSDLSELWMQPHYHGSGHAPVFLDADGDGVCDALDQCPDTPSDVEVDENGIQVDDSVKKLFPNHAEHDPSDLAAALTIAADSSVLPLGILENTAWERKAVQLNPGDALVLYTDGLTDVVAPDERMYSLEQLKALLLSCARLPADDMCRAVFERLEAFRGVAEQHDDMTMVILRVS